VFKYGVSAITRSIDGGICQHYQHQSFTKFGKCGCQEEKQRNGQKCQGGSAEASSSGGSACCYYTAPPTASRGRSSSDDSVTHFRVICLFGRGCRRCGGRHLLLSIGCRGGSRFSSGQPSGFVCRNNACRSSDHVHTVVAGDYHRYGLVAMEFTTT
jgi:hypothetical protein